MHAKIGYDDLITPCGPLIEAEWKMLFRVVTDADVVVYETLQLSKARAVETIWKMAHAIHTSEPDVNVYQVIDGEEVLLTEGLAVKVAVK